MDVRFKGVKVLIWDFDGTLYRQRPEIWNQILESEYRVVENHTGWSRKKVTEEFHKIYKVKTPSGTQTAALLSGIPVSQAATEGEQYIDKSKYLRRDERLVQLFKQLNRYIHYMLVNGIRASTEKNLRLLGLSPKIFTEIVSSEVVGENKPSEKGFRYILEKNKLPPEVHLMIGDRDAVDLATAQKLGMKTCLVWGKSEIADITLPTVYELAHVLL